MSVLVHLRLWVCLFSGVWGGQVSQHWGVLGWRRVCYSHSYHHGKSSRHTGTLWSKCLIKKKHFWYHLCTWSTCICVRKLIFSKKSRTQSCFYAVLIHVFSMTTPVSCVRERLMIRLRVSPLSVCSWWGTRVPAGAGSALLRRLGSLHLSTQTSPTTQPRPSLPGGWTTWFSPQSTETVMASSLSVSTSFFWNFNFHLEMRELFYRLETNWCNIIPCSRFYKVLINLESYFPKQFFTDYISSK